LASGENVVFGQGKVVRVMRSGVGVTLSIRRGQTILCASLLLPLSDSD